MIIVFLLCAHKSTMLSVPSLFIFSACLIIVFSECPTSRPSTYGCPRVSSLFSLPSSSSPWSTFSVGEDERWSHRLLSTSRLLRTVQVLAAKLPVPLATVPPGWIRRKAGPSKRWVRCGTGIQTFLALTPDNLYLLCCCWCGMSLWYRWNAT